METRFWSAEETQIAKKEKEDKFIQTIERMKEKVELSPTQQAFVSRCQTALAKLQNSYVPRPSRQLYQGKPNIILGIAMGLDKPATVAVVDLNTGKVITFRNIKQLLGENHRLLNRQRQQKKNLSHLQHKAATRSRTATKGEATSPLCAVQKRFGANQKGESNLGDRLIAKAIVELAQQSTV